MPVNHLCVHDFTSLKSSMCAHKNAYRRVQPSVYHKNRILYTRPIRVYVCVCLFYVNNIINIHSKFERYEFEMEMLKCNKETDATDFIWNKWSHLDGIT